MKDLKYWQKIGIYKERKTSAIPMDYVFSFPTHSCGHKLWWGPKEGVMEISFLQTLLKALDKERTVDT